MDRGKIVIIGLGPGKPGHITHEAWQILSRSPQVFLRTSQHPVVQALPEALRVTSFDNVYEQHKSFEEVYQAIADRVIDLASDSEEVLYGVPGDPNVAEATTELIRQRAENLGIDLHIVSGMSFLEPVFQAVNLDPLPRLALVDALEIGASHHPSFPPDFPALIPQLYSQDLAAEVKLTLMGNFPDEHGVYLVHHAGTDEELVEELKLYEIDRSPEIGPLTCLYVPPLDTGTSMESFQELIAHLRAPEGCPWDREQTHLSLRPYLLEETYETLAALDAQDSGALEEELGDLLIQIVLHAQIASEEGDFNLSSVIKKVSNKLIYRHPHVFGDVSVDSAEAVKKNWEQLKSEERKKNRHNEAGSLYGVPEALPALSVADAYQKRAARVGFDWPAEEGVLGKIREELDEVLAALGSDDIGAEIGDLIFAVVNLARWNDLDAESLLRETNAKFKFRFEKIEEVAKKSGRDMQDLSLAEMDEIWEASKG